MAEQFPGLVTTYVGPNASHRVFRTHLANAKALAFVLAQHDSTVLRGFLDHAEAARRKSPDGNFPIGMAGGGSTTTTVQLAIHVTATEARLIEDEPGGFQSQALGLVYREVQRIFELGSICSHRSRRARKVCSSPVRNSPTPRHSSKQSRSSPKPHH